MAKGKGHGRQRREVFVLVKGKEVQAKRLKKILRADAQALVNEGKAEFCNREKAKQILAKSKPKEEAKPKKSKKKKKEADGQPAEATTD